MKPRIMFRGDGSNFLQWIDGAGINGSGGCYHHSRNSTSRIEFHRVRQILWKMRKKSSTLMVRMLSCPMPSSATALRMDICTSEEAYTAMRLPSDKPRSFAGVLASRAIAKAMRLALDPPEVRVPLKPEHPIACANQEITVRSMVTAAGAERQAVTFWFKTAQSNSIVAETASPEPRT